MNSEKNLIAKHFGLRGIAVFEAGKGLLALAVAIWVLTLMHKDMEVVAERILNALHISPDRHFAQRIMRAAEKITDRNLWIFIFWILVYTTVRFVEAAGLWLEKEWAEWFALLSGSMYMPWEIWELARRPSAFKWGILGVNVLIVLYVAWLLMDSHKRKREMRETIREAKLPEEI